MVHSGYHSLKHRSPEDSVWMVHSGYHPQTSVTEVIINCFGICFMLNVCVLSRYLSRVVEICYMLNVCVCCLAIQAMLYVKCLCVLSRYLSPVVEILMVHVPEMQTIHFFQS